MNRNFTFQYGRAEEVPQVFDITLPEELVNRFNEYYFRLTNQTIGLLLSNLDMERQVVLEAEQEANTLTNEKMQEIIQRQLEENCRICL